MNKYYIKSMLFGCLLSFMAINVMSQEIHNALEQDDDFVVNDEIPGILFSTDKISSTGSVAKISGEDMYKTSASNLTQTVSGRLPGLFSVSGNGTPGWDDASWYIRGVASYAYGGQAHTHKFFVDGFEVNLDYITNISPTEIKSISVLKDAAALSTLGMRGANGVIWIETRHGEIGDMKVNFKTRTGIQQAINIKKPLNSYDFANLYNQAISNDNGMTWTPTYSDAQLDAYKNGTGTNVDWYDEALRKNGYYSDADFTFYGGTQAIKYNVIFNYANQQGLFNVDNTDQSSNIRFQRFNMRANLEINMLKILQVNITLGGRIEDRFRPNYNSNSLMNNLARYPSNIYPVYDSQVVDDLSNFSGTALYPNNPVGSLNGLGWANDRWRNMQMNYRFKENLDFITEGLYLEEAFSFYAKSEGGYAKTKNYARYYNGLPQTTDETTSITAGSYGAYGMGVWLQGAITLGYKNSFGIHDINSALNLHVSDYKGDGLFGYLYRYLNYNGKVNYTYDKRYVAEFGFSYFGSDAYASGNRFGFYPAISAAWIASNESFLESSDMINFLKFRASVGKTGGSGSGETGQIEVFASDGRYLYQQYYVNSQVGSFYTGQGNSFSNQGTLAPLFIANSEVFAEQSVKYNAGIDLNLFKKIDLTVDLFMDKRSGILTYDNSILGYYGRVIQFNNIGEMTNKGFEASISYNDKVDDLNYSLYGMAFFAKNTIDYMAEVTPAYSYNARTGRSYGAAIGLEAIGYYQLSDFNADGSLKPGIPEPMFGAVQPGDIRYRDIDDDKFVDQNDVTEVGNPSLPSWMFSFGGDAAYKGFDFSVLFTGSAGASISLLNNPNQMVAFVDNGNAYDWAKEAWAYYPEKGIDTRASAKYPRLTTLENENNYRASSFWMRKNDFLRLKNVEIGYDFCNRLIKESSISKLRLYVNALNPVTISNLLKDYNMDPESPYNSYPMLKSYNIGIQVNF